MRKCMYLLIFIFCTSVLKAQVLLIDKTIATYTVNENDLSANGKLCKVINYLSKNYINYEPQRFKLLVVIKTFEYSSYVELPAKPKNAILFADYVESTALPKLKADMLLKSNNFRSSFTGSNLNLFDSLIIYDGNTYRFLPGITIVEFFDLFEFKQKDVLQTNQTTFNTQATVAKIYSWTKRDSLPIPDVEDLIASKLFLLKKEGDKYTFFRHSSGCEDCPLTFYNEYVYKKNYGVIAFRSKYLYKNSDPVARRLSGKVIESNEYYYFR